MFRLAVRLQSRSFSKSSRLYSTPSKVISVRISPSLWSASDNYLQPETPPKFSTPKDWKIIETHLGGIERSFVHRKTNYCTWYTPEGMSPAEILAVPGAWKYWSTVEDVEEYIKEMEKEKAENGGKDYMDDEVKIE